MQTFLPYEDFAESARVLDYRRLGKQRVEAWQIIKALNGESRGWVNHPAVKMWDGHIPALAQYAIAITEEWISRGYNDSMLERFRAIGGEVKLPDWLGNRELHISHRSNLIRKLPEFYGPLWPGLDGSLEYVWPTRAGLTV